MSELEKFQSEIEESVEKLRNSVVTINTRRMARSFGYGVTPVMGSGSGIIVDAKGYVVTNNHVLEGSEEAEVVLPSGERTRGDVLGGDPATDIAIVKINADNLSQASLADSDDVKPGRMVLAIGNTLSLPGGPTVSMGLIGAVGRPLPWADFIFEGLIQTDAAINPGNSGGPLANLSGEVIGINTAMIPYAQGVGFAIPSNTVKRVMSDIISHGRVIRPWIGISGMDVNREMARAYRLGSDRGVLVARVSYGSPADHGGLEAGDVITAIGDRNIRNMKDFLGFLSGEKIGEAVEVLVKRGRHSFRTRIRLDEPPETTVINSAWGR